MPQTLAEKIAEVGRSIPNLLKQGDNGEYSFLRAVDVFDAIRGKLFEKGIMIYPAGVVEVTRSNPYLAISDDITDEVILKMRYHITDGSETLVCETAGIGQDHQGKALYMASTGAKKDLLKSLFLIAGFEDDVEREKNIERIPDGLAVTLDEAEKRFCSDLREHPISRCDVIAWGQACVQSKKRNAAREQYLETAGVKTISELKRKDFAAAMAWATNETA